MITGIYAIKDAKSAFMSCTVDVNDATAIRNFEHAVRLPDSILSSHANDFALYKVGVYDDGSGEISPVFPPVHLCDAAQCLVKE
jgi:hypothetical protein